MSTVAKWSPISATAELLLHLPAVWNSFYNDPRTSNTIRTINLNSMQSLSCGLQHVGRFSHPALSGSFLDDCLYKCSAIAEMAEMCDRLATIDMGRKEGALCCCCCCPVWAEGTSVPTGILMHPACLSCPVCPVCDVGVLWPNGWMDQECHLAWR